MTRTVMAILLAAFTVAFTTAFTAANASAQDVVQTQTDVEYAVHDGTSLKGDLYQPASTGPHPVLILIHGGSFRGGSKDRYGRSWGPYLAERGYVVFAIDYRLSTPAQTTWPQALLDCKAAVQFLRGNATALGVDPERIGIGGDSAGGTLAALVALTQDMPAFANKYPEDAYAAASSKVKVVVPIYGVYDMMSWRRYTLDTGNKARSNSSSAEPPTRCRARISRRRPSPTCARRQRAWAWCRCPTRGRPFPGSWRGACSTRSCRPESQSVVLVQALEDAGADVTAIAIPNTGHLFFRGALLTGRQGDPVCEDTSGAGYSCSGASPNDYIASQFLGFLRRGL